MSLGTAMAEADGDREAIKFEKLHGRSNWPTWKFNMRLYLIDKDLWEVVEVEPIPPHPPQLFDVETSRKVARSLARIGLSLDPSQQIYITTCTTGHQAWSTLTSMYDTRDQASQLARRQNFFSMRMSTDESVNSWIGRVSYESAQCILIGIRIEDADQVSVILNGLTDHFQPVRRTLLSHASITGTTLTLLTVHQALLNDEMAEAVAAGEGPTAFSSKVGPSSKNRTKRDRQGLLCTWCGKKNSHTENECFKKRDGKPKSFSPNASNTNQQSKSNDGGRTKKPTISFTACIRLFAVNAPLSQASWLVDSGSNAHLVVDRSCFLTYETSQLLAELAGEEMDLGVVGKGTARFEVLDDDGAHQPITLADAYHTPRARSNLVSLGCLIEKGAHPKFLNDGTMVIYQGRVKVFSAPMVGKLWAIPTTQLFQAPSSLTALSTNVETASMQLWHERLGHLANTNVLKLESMVDGMKISDRNVGTLCHGCETGKGHRIPFPTSTSRASVPFELVHCDLAGPMRVPTPEGAKYFVLFIDDATRMLFVSIIRNKSDAMQCLKELKAAIERQTRWKLQRFRSDNDSVFMSKNGQEFFKTNGIAHETTVPYTPSQNGVSERSIRTVTEFALALLEHARSLMVIHQVDETLWGEAVKTAVYLLNRSPHSAINGALPIQQYSGQRPHLGHLRTFGSAAYVHIAKEKRAGKFGSHRKLVLFIGYPTGQKAWRFYDPSTGKFLVARDASFLETNRTETITFALEDSDSVNQIEEVTDKSPSLDSVGGGTDVAPQSAPDTSATAPTAAGTSGPPGNVVTPPAPPPTSGPTDTAVVRSSNPPAPSRLPTRIQPTRAQRPRSEWSSNLQSLSTTILAFSVIIPETYSQAMASEESDHWAQAIAIEYSSLIDNGTWTLVDLPPDRKAIDGKWVFDLKRNNDGQIERYKARYVARGFRQVANVDYFDTASPVVRHETLRIFFTLVASLDLELYQVDALTAFLQGDLQEEVYMKQPEGHVVAGQENKVCLLNKAIYGLKQASYAWYAKLVNGLRSLGYVPVPSDPCLFIRHHDGSFILLAVYVDDIVIAGPSMVEILEFLVELEFVVNIKHVGEVKRYLGYEVERDRPNRLIHLRQRRFSAELVERFGQTDAKPVSTPMVANWKPVDGEPVDSHEYRSGTGGLNYLAGLTRPDLSFSTGMLSRYNANPSSSHRQGLIRGVRYVNSTTDAVLTLGGDTPLNLRGFVDSSYADDPTTARSTLGYAFQFGRGLVAWSSKRQYSVALSSTEAEYMAATSAAKEALWLSSLITQLAIPGISDPVPVPIFGDNQGSIVLSKTPTYHPRSKHIAVRYHFIRETVANGLVTYEYIPTDELMADTLTKSLPLDKFHRFARAMGLSFPSLHSTLRSSGSVGVGELEELPGSSDHADQADTEIRNSDRGGD